MPRLSQSPRFVSAAAAAGGAAFLFAGCTDQATPPKPVGPPIAVKQSGAAHDHDHEHDHDHGHDHAKPGSAAEHAHPTTLAAAVTELRELVGKVKEALAAGDRDKADGPVHAVGHLLEDMEGLVAKAKLPAEREAAVKTALGEIFAAFDALDTAIHGDADKPVEFAPHAEAIEKAIGVLGEGT
jgi:hypothetical protein